MPPGGAPGMRHTEFVFRLSSLALAPQGSPQGCSCTSKATANAASILSFHHDWWMFTHCSSKS